MSLNAGYGPLIESYQHSITLTDEQARCYQLKEQEQREDVRCVPAGLPPEILLARHLREVKTSNSANAVVKNSDLKMYHVMSVKQSLREDLAEHSYQFSCRAADWSSMFLSQVPMQFGPLELHVVDALGVYEELPIDHATSVPLPAGLLLVTKPTVHGGPARKKARIVICGNFQDVHPQEFTASTTPRYPSLRMALLVASHMSWPIECWDVSVWDRDTDLRASGRKK